MQPIVGEGLAHAGPQVGDGADVPDTVVAGVGQVQRASADAAHPVPAGIERNGRGGGIAGRVGGQSTGRMVGHAEGIIASCSGFEYTGYTTLGVVALVSDDAARWIGDGNQLIVAVVRVLTVEHIRADDIPPMGEASSRVIRE